MYGGEYEVPIGYTSTKQNHNQRRRKMFQYGGALDRIARGACTKF